MKKTILLLLALLLLFSAALADTQLHSGSVLQDDDCFDTLLELLRTDSPVENASAVYKGTDGAPDMIIMTGTTAKEAGGRLGSMMTAYSAQDDAYPKTTGADGTLWQECLQLVAEGEEKAHGMINPKSSKKNYVLWPGALYARSEDGRSIQAMLFFCTQNKKFRTETARYTPPKNEKIYALISYSGSAEGDIVSGFPKVTRIVADDALVWRIADQLITSFDRSDNGGLIPKPMRSWWTNHEYLGEEETVRLSLDEMTVRKSTTGRLTLVYTGVANEKNVKVKWATADKKIATVNGGKIKGVKTGTTQITATVTLPSGRVEVLTCTVTVIAK